MLTKEKIIAALQAMPETEFEDIDVLLERLIDLAREERQNSTAFKDSQQLQEPLAVYEAVEKSNFGATDENIPQMIAHINKKIERATDLETIYLLKKIKKGLEDSMAGNYFTVEEVQAKIDSWFTK